MIRRLCTGIFVVITLLFGSSLLMSANVSAAEPNPTPKSTNCAIKSSGFLDFPTWYKYLSPHYVPADPNANPPQAEDCKLTFPEDSEGKESVVLAIPRILLAVFEIILRIAGLAAVGFIIFGGFQYLISQGEPERTKGAKSTILNAVIGLAIAMSATVIVNLIGKNIV